MQDPVCTAPPHAASGRGQGRSLCGADPADAITPVYSDIMTETPDSTTTSSRAATNSTSSRETHPLRHSNDQCLENAEQEVSSEASQLDKDSPQPLSTLLTECQLRSRGQGQIPSQESVQEHHQTQPRHRRRGEGLRSQLLISERQVRVSRLDICDPESSICRSEFRGLINLCHIAAAIWLVAAPVYSKFENGYWFDYSMLHAAFGDFLSLMTSWAFCLAYSFS